jgi:hypothetical protein
VGGFNAAAATLSVKAHGAKSIDRSHMGNIILVASELVTTREVGEDQKAKYIPASWLQFWSMVDDGSQCQPEDGRMTCRIGSHSALLVHE